MRRLWKYIERMSMSDSKKQRCFIVLNIIESIVLVLVVSILIGLFHGMDAAWLEATIIGVGYSAFCFGFLGGWLYLCNHT